MIRRELKINVDEGYIEVSGDSNPDHVDMSWAKFSNALNDYKQNYKSLCVDFKLNSFNSSTQRYILVKLRDMDLMAYNQQVEVNWHYPDDDDDILYFGEVYRDFCKKISIKLIPYKYKK